VLARVVGLAPTGPVGARESDPGGAA
jgi:hypothetical protein